MKLKIQNTARRKLWLAVTNISYWAKEKHILLSFSREAYSQILKPHLTTNVLGRNIYNFLAWPRALPKLLSAKIIAKSWKRKNNISHHSNYVLFPLMMRRPSARNKNLWIIQLIPWLFHISALQNTTWITAQTLLPLCRVLFSLPNGN